ncbi:TPA: isopentenyl-diphosphate Delta-isomerase [Enterobacter kobei]|nr:isopentenyl-diphosphate Delta-isomerase [Enterobacter kobei]
MKEMLVLVDNEDRQIGIGEKLHVHREGLLHRAFSIFIFNDLGQLLLQQRASSKYHSGSLWTNTCCSHPRPGEDTLDAAHRRLKEELGFDCELTRVTTLLYKDPVPSTEGLIEHEYDHIYIGRFNGTISPNPFEVSGCKWIEITQLLRDIDDNPELFTSWFKRIVQEIDLNIYVRPETYTPDMLSAYQADLLSKVSRTFALTIPQLPHKLYLAVANAYLLCRIADTIEDEPAITLANKVIYENKFLDVVKGKISVHTFSRDLKAQLTAETPSGERELVDYLPLVLEAHKQLNTSQQKAIVDCLTIMTHGMHDFQQKVSINGLATRQDLDQYCYCVAGVVGEMLTAFFIDFDPSLSRQRSELTRLAVSFGTGLQLTNILKDQWEDRQRGVCWLPRDLFSGYGVELAELHPGLQSSETVERMQVLIGTAHAHLKLALRYALRIPKRYSGIRRFILWATGWALLTLRNLCRTPHFCSGEEVKLSRKDVKLVMSLTRSSQHFDTGLRLLFKLAAKGLPLTPLDGNWTSPAYYLQPWPRSSLPFIANKNERNQAFD